MSFVHQQNNVDITTNLIYTREQQRSNCGAMANFIFYHRTITEMILWHGGLMSSFKHRGSLLEVRIIFVVTETEWREGSFFGIRMNITFTHINRTTSRITLRRYDQHYLYKFEHQSHTTDYSLTTDQSHFYNNETTSRMIFWAHKQFYLYSRDVINNHPSGRLGQILELRSLQPHRVPQGESHN